MENQTQTRYVVSLLFKKYALGATSYNESLRTDIVPAISGEEAFGIFYDQCRKQLGNGYDLIMKTIVPVIETGIVATLEQTEDSFTKEEMIRFAKYSKSYQTPKSVEGAFDKWKEKREENSTTDVIHLNKAEIQSKHSRVNHAEGLISQLPETHDGRNTWLMNYGTGPESMKLRGLKNLKFDDTTLSCELAGENKDMFHVVDKVVE